MDSLMINKVVGAVLTAGIAFFVFGWFGNTAVRVRMPREAVIPVDMGTIQTAAATAPAAPAGPEPIAAILASADVGAGEGTAKKVCSACHQLQEGGANAVGPALYGVVGRPQAKAAGYTYSAALSGKAGNWSYDALNQWLYKPSAYAQGTKMSYAGLPNTKDRANLIAYLRTLSKDPAPLPDEKEIAAAKTAVAPTKTADAGATAPGGAVAGGTGSSAAPVPEPPFPALLAAANPDAGKADTVKLGCIACHKFVDGGANGVGPALYGVVGREKASVATYTYSVALKAKGGNWTYDELNAWLTKPSAYAPGTKMSYAGIADAHTRADVISYLRTLAANPEPLPAATTPETPAVDAKGQETQPLDTTPK